MLGTPGLRAPLSQGSWTGIMKQRKDPTTSERSAWVVLVTSYYNYRKVPYFGGSDNY